ncbi:MAG: helix-turn-helix transcriptional regulator [Candidatus Bathyarchaeia archaeon]|jgi:DNA-binding transcriptional ArsR family regulator
MEEVDWSSLHKILSDTTRRSILELLAEKEALSYTEIMALLHVTNTGRLNYHLKALGTLISKDDQGKYHLTERGKLSVNLLQTFPERATVDRKKHLSGLKIAAAVVLLLVGILLISSAAGLFLFSLQSPTTANTIRSGGVLNQLIPQNTTVSLLSWDVQTNASQLNISWSASSPVFIYVMNTTQHDSLLLQHTINGQALAALENFTGIPSSWVSQYDLQTGSVSLSLPQGQYYFLASSSTEAILNSFTLTQQQATGGSAPSPLEYLLVLFPLALGTFMIVLALLILTRRVWR